MTGGPGDAKALLAKGRSGDALLLAQQEHMRGKQNGDEKLQVDASVMMAEIYLGRQQPEMALRTIKASLASCKNIGDKKTEASVLQTVANAFIMVSASQPALNAAQQLEAVADGLGDKEAKADGRSLAAQALLCRGDTAGALEKATEAVDLHKAAGAKRGLGVALQTLAEVHIRRGVGDKALSASQDAAALFKELGDRSGQAAALNAAAGALQLRGENEEGLKKAREALLLFRQAGDSKGEAVAKATCARLRPKPEVRMFTAPAKNTNHWIPNFTAPCQERAEPFVDVYRLIGSAEEKILVGQLAIVTGASRGLGKSIAMMLAEAGCIVYVTARSAPGRVTDGYLGGTVDESASAFNKLGGVGVATHLDHAQKSQSKALAELITNNHGKLDILVNNAYSLPGPDENFYGMPLWQQPTRYLDEQVAVGSMNHIAMTLYMLPLLRRGKGLTCNISNAGSQMNLPTLPVSFVCAKASFDRTMSALSERVRHQGVYILTLWPGLVRTERTKAVAMRANQAKLIDYELSRFSGLAVRQLAALERVDLSRLASTRRTLATTDVAKFDVDGYAHEGNLRTIMTGGRTPFSK